jgi:hypothetical protein
MQPIVFRDLPGIAELEHQYLLYLDNRLMKPEREELERRLNEKSVELFGITQDETLHWNLPQSAMSGTPEQWERHFEFIEDPRDEEGEFWDFFDIDVTDGKGMQLGCLYAFGRQLVCALKRLHPDAIVSFRPGTDQNMQAAAEAWGKRLMAGRQGSHESA